MLSDILKALQGVFSFGSNLSDPEQYSIKTIKRLKYNLEAAQNYIFVDEKSGEYKDISDKKRDKLKLHFRKRVFDES